MKSFRLLSIVTVFATLAAAVRAVGGQTPVSRTVTVEQRLVLAGDQTPAGLRRRALEEAMAEAVRVVAGVRLQSSAISVLEENGALLRDGYASIVQLDAAGRAVDVKVIEERWEITPAGLPLLVLRAEVAVERDIGEPDPGFRVELSADRVTYAAGRTPATSDEVVLTVTATREALVALWSIADDSATLLSPDDYGGWIRVKAGTAVEVPSREWRERGLRFRASLPEGIKERAQLLVAVALEPGAAVRPLPPRRASVLEYQKWLVRIPSRERASGFVRILVVRGQESKGGRGLLLEPPRSP
ncbi:MAG: hypothetical protein ACT4OZ_13375 [Gemmatimonadota bacterium]